MMFANAGSFIGNAVSNFEELEAYRKSGWSPYDIVSVEWVRNAIKLSAEFKKIGADPAHLNDLFDADKDGRVVVLPCKVGDMVYTVGYYGGDNYPVIAELKVVSLEQIVRWVEQGLIGKTIFLSREDAEAALSEVFDEAD